MVKGSAGGMFAAWARLWTIPVACADAGVRMVETMTFAPLVVQTRLPAIQDAIIDPWSADHAELQRMVGEKMVAWSKAAVSLQRDAMTLTFRSLSRNPTQM